MATRKDDDVVEVYEDYEGRYGWRRTSAEGDTVAESIESFDDSKAAKAAARNYNQDVSTEIVDPNVGVAPAEQSAPVAKKAKAKKAKKSKEK